MWPSWSTICWIQGFWGITIVIPSIVLLSMTMSVVISWITTALTSLGLPCLVFSSVILIWGWGKRGHHSHSPGFRPSRSVCRIWGRTITQITRGIPHSGVPSVVLGCTASLTSSIVMSVLVMLLPFILFPWMTWSRGGIPIHVIWWLRSRIFRIYWPLHVVGNCWFSCYLDIISTYAIEYYLWLEPVVVVLASTGCAMPCCLALSYCTQIHMVQVIQIVIYFLLLKLFNFSIFFQVLVGFMGFSPSIPFLFRLNSLAGHEVGIIFLPCLIFLSCWCVQDVHHLMDIAIHALSATTTILTGTVRLVCGPRWTSGHL